MRRSHRIGFRTLIALALVASAVLAAAGVSASAASRHYKNPFSRGAWAPARTDMGVDYLPLHRESVLAIGRARILGSTRHSGWPGGGLIWYQLLKGNHRGDIVYVAEHLRHLAPAGSVVKKGQKIALALPHYPWTESGWANSYGSPRAMPCYKEGKKTNSGKEFARFLIKLGVEVADDPGPGADYPTGRRC